MSDLSHKIATAYNVLNTVEDDVNEGYCNNGTFLINPDGIIKFMEIGSPNIMKDTDELLRLISAYQFSNKYSVVCQSNWKPGKKGINPTNKDPRLQRYWTEELLKEEYIEDAAK